MAFAVTRRPFWSFAAILVSVALLAFASAADLRAQPRPASDVEFLRQLIRDVELQHRVLLRSREGFYSVTADSIGWMFASQVLTRGLPADSVVPRALRIRAESNRILGILKMDLQEREARRQLAEETRTWGAADGTWSMSCQGAYYPPQIQGQIGYVERVDAPGDRPWFRFDLYRDLWGLITTLGSTVDANAAKGEVRRVQIPGPDFGFDDGTLVWDARLTEKTPTAPGVDGTIHVSGNLRFKGNDGECTGTMEAG